MKCGICKKQLTDPASIAKGVGPDCENRRAQIIAESGLTLSSLQITEEIASEPNVTRWLTVAERAAIRGNRRDVEIFKAAAIRAADRELAARILRIGIAA